MPSVMMTIETPPSKDGAPPTLEEAAGRLGVPVSALDAEFGVSPIDPDAGAWAVLLKDETDVPDAPGEGVEGPFSNPAIAPYGPPEN